MGIVVPRPAMRGREASIITARLRQHAEITALLVAQGWDREAASKEALRRIRAETRKED